MSLAALATRAVNRREDTPAKDRPQGIREAAEGQQPTTSQASTVADTAKQVAAFVPTEVITLYTAALAITTGNATKVSTGQVTAFWCIVTATPIIAWILYATSCRSQGKPLPFNLRVWPWQEMIIASLAFVVWAGMLPATPFRNFSWYTPALGGFIGLVFTVAVGLVTPLLPGKIKTGSAA